MKMTLAERFAAQGLLPKEADFVTLKIVRDLNESLSPSEEEIVKWEVKTFPMSSGVGTTWNEKAKTEETEIKMGEVATNIFVAALKKLEEGGKLTLETISLYEKFIEKDT